MDIGMLWFDNDPKADLQSKVNKAAAYYRTKYGGEPNLCFVHPSMMPDAITAVGEITLKSNGSMIPHHFWIGVQLQPAPIP